MRDLKVGSVASLTEVVECAPITCMSAMHHHLPNYTSLAREDHVRRFAEREGGRVSRTLPSSPHLAVKREREECSVSLLGFHRQQSKYVNP